MESAETVGHATHLCLQSIDTRGHQIALSLAQSSSDQFCRCSDRGREREKRAEVLRGAHTGKKQPRDVALQMLIENRKAIG